MSRATKCQLIISPRGEALYKYKYHT